MRRRRGRMSDDMIVNVVAVAAIAVVATWVCSILNNK